MCADVQTPPSPAALLLLSEDDRVENRQNKLQGLIICQKIFGALDIIYCKCMLDYKLAGVNS